MASAAGNLANAVVTALQAISWSPSPSGNMTVKDRKVPTVAEDNELPLINVSITEGEEVEDAYAGKVFVKYPVTVAIATKGNQALGDTSSIRSWRQQIRKALNVTALSGAPELQDSWPRGKAPFDASALAAGYNWSLLTVTYMTLEDRT